MSRNRKLAEGKRARKRKREQGRRKRQRQAREGQPGPKAQRRAAAAEEAAERARKGVRMFDPQVLVDLARDRLRLAALRVRKSDPWAKKETEPTEPEAKS